MEWRWTVVTSLLVLLPAVLPAQDSWDRALLEAGKPHDIPRTSAPNSECALDLSLGDSVLILGNPKRTALLSYYRALPFGLAGGWSIARLQATADTLRTSIAAFECGAPRPGIILSAGGRYVRLTTEDLPTEKTVESSGQEFGGLMPVRVRYLGKTIVSVDTIIVDHMSVSPGPFTWVATASAARSRKKETVRADSIQAATKTRARDDSINSTKWTAATKRLVREGRVALGMTSAMVRLAWGQPEKINRTMTANAITEQWVYGDSFVYLTNGRVTAIQDSR